MNREEGIKYWVDIAEYDLETARVMLETKRFLYVGFMCHQVIEKILKALWVSVQNEIPPYTHNLMLLAKESKIYSLLSEKQINFIQKLRPLNVESRYPEYKEKIFKSLNEKKCRDILKDTEELFQWIKAKL